MGWASGWLKVWFGWDAVWEQFGVGFVGSRVVGLRLFSGGFRVCFRKVRCAFREKGLEPAVLRERATEHQAIRSVNGDRVLQMACIQANAKVSHNDFVYGRFKVG